MSTDSSQDSLARSLAAIRKQSPPVRRHVTVVDRLRLPGVLDEVKEMRRERRSWSDIASLFGKVGVKVSAGTVRKAFNELVTDVVPESRPGGRRRAARNQKPVQQPADFEASKGPAPVVKTFSGLVPVGAAHARGILDNC